jgi:hypothetical protein
MIDAAMPYFLLMLAGHLVADGILQPPLLSRAKRVGGVAELHWGQALAIHAGLHAGWVAAITGSWALGLAEWLAHTAIDIAKTRRWIGTLTDQLLHLGCKAAWALVLVESWHG